MADFFVTLKISDSNHREAWKTAGAIADAAQAMLVTVESVKRSKRK